MCGMVNSLMESSFLQKKDYGEEINNSSNVKNLGLVLKSDFSSQSPERNSLLLKKGGCNASLRILGHGGGCVRDGEINAGIS